MTTDDQTSSLPPGTRIGPYELAEPIGAGGMGEVYRATDTKLRRTVAIKVLPPGFTRDPERLARFEREAQLLAQLHHPNIASIFGIEEADGVLALALELVEGPTLADRLAGGPLPVEDAVAIAVQIALALEQAHERGIVHRDLKPQNVKAPVGGDVKVLDFGLAKAMEGAAAPGAAADLSLSPTILEAPATTGPATQAGVIMGTAPYMSPEQAKGSPVDKRGDIWAFGVVLYEMLTGVSPFAGPSVAETLAAVLRSDIDLAALPAETPAEIVRLLRRCLERDPRNRLHDIADARIVLQEVAAGVEEGVADGAPTAATSAASPSALQRWLPWAVTAVALATALWFGSQGTGPEQLPEPPAPTAFGMLVPEGTYLPTQEWPLLDLSEDGRTLLVVAEDADGWHIFRRSLDRLEFTRVEGTEGGVSPILSPDGRSIAFVADGELRKVPVEGGAAVSLASAQAYRGGAWTADGAIVYAPLYNSGLWQVSGTGGTPVELTTLDADRRERTHRWPQVLPDGNTLIFTVGFLENTSDYDISTIDAVRLDTGERRTILEGARMARYTSGYLVFQRRSTLLAVRFDLDRLEAIGEPFVLQEGMGGDTGAGVGHFAVSSRGAIAIVPDRAIPVDRVLTLVDREGLEAELAVPAASYISPRFSPDGVRVAFVIGQGGLSDDDVYLIELESARTQRLTFSGARGFPVWSPDGLRLAYTVGTTGGQGLATKAADGSGDESRIPLSNDTDYFLIPDAWMPDGRLLVTDVQRSLDVLVVTMNTGEVTPLLGNPEASEYASVLSPDGRFVAYSSTEGGANEVFVETFPPGSGKWQVSTAGGACPTWAADGTELYFAVGPAIMVAEVELGGVFRSGPPRELFSGAYTTCRPGGRDYDVGADGRFIMVKRKLVAGVPHQMVLLEGWQSADPEIAAAR